MSQRDVSLPKLPIFQLTKVVKISLPSDENCDYFHGGAKSFKPHQFIML
jgi:hypothetical protein